MYSSYRLFLIPVLVSIPLLLPHELFAQETMPFTGEVNAENINIRADSTVNSRVICRASKGERLEVTSALYGWYKIRLPKHAPSFIKKNLTAGIEDRPANSFDKLKASGTDLNRNAKVIKERVNIRLSPNESSPILGKADKNEIITILGESGEWYKIEPINNSFGWINSKFISKAPAVVKRDDPLPQATAPPEPQNSIVAEGMIKPYGIVIKRVATHKLITDDKKIFLLKGDKKSLDALNHHKVKVIGKFIEPNNQKYPVIEIEKMEELD